MKRKALLRTLTVLAVIAFAGITFAGNADNGKSLFNNPALGSNGRTCSSCHRDGKGINGTKSVFRIIGREFNDPADAINFCLKIALKGNPLQKESQEMQDLVAYIKSLKPGKKKRIIGC